MKVGIKSSRGGEFWLPVGDENAEFGFLRDGDWHTVSIPLNRYANTDFNTIHQMFMIAGDPPPAALNLSIDNVWWEPSVARPTPANGNFGVYTETGAHQDAGEFALGVDGDFFVWENTLVPGTQDPYEGSESISLQSAPGPTWFGAAFTPNVKHNLAAFDNPNGKLRFAMKTSASTTFHGRDEERQHRRGRAEMDYLPGRQRPLRIRAGRRNGMRSKFPWPTWGRKSIFREVSQLFQILGTTGPISDIELDDIYFTGGAALQTNVVSADIQDGVGISWPTSPGTNYTVQWTADLDHPDGCGTPWPPPSRATGRPRPCLIPSESTRTEYYRVLQLP